MKKTKQYIEEYLKYSIGYTQIALSTDFPTFWVIIEFIAQIQRIAMVFLFEEVLHILQSRRQLEISYSSDYWALKQISKIFVPTIFMADMFSNNSIIVIQIFLIILLFSPLMAIAGFIEFEKSTFATIQFRSQVGGSENSTLSINLLNRSYNMTNYIENFLYQQLMGNDQRSWLNTVRNFLAKLLNTYPHIFTIPLMYWNLLLVLLVIYDVNISSNQQLFMVVLNIFTTVEMIILWVFSMIAQRSYSMFDNNHLRIMQSTWFNISQVVKFMPIVVQFIYFLYSQTQYDVSIQNVITVIVQINLIGDLLDFFISIPYMFEYKQNVSFFSLTTALTISFAHEFQMNQVQMFSMCLICIPLATKLIKDLFSYVLKLIFDKQFFKEKQKQPAKPHQGSGQRQSKVLEDELQPFVIEKEMQELKQQQIEALKNQHFRYFVHYLRYISFLRLSDQQSLDQNSDLNSKKSEFLINIIVLIKSHVSNCNSVYCYCKGFRGEKRYVIDCKKSEIDMRIFSPITINNIQIQVELIERYIRHYTKYVFEIENNEINPNIFRLSQLFLSMCDSEECYQTMMLVADYKQKNIKNESNNTMMNEIALTLIIGLAKFKVLQKMKNNMAQEDVETGIKYKNFRITEIRRDQLITRIFHHIDSKYKFLKHLLECKLNFSELYEQIEQQVINQNIQKDIEIFYKYSNCRTSLLVCMFYTLEVNCDFEKFIRLKNQLKTKNYKFFEYPTTNSNSIQIQAFKVLYLKTNLARRLINGQFFRGQIMDFSNNSPMMLGYEPREFKEQILTVHQLVTPNLAHFHDQLLEIFFLTNKPAVIRKRRPLLMQKKFKELVFCEMFLDLSFNITEEAFPIYCFLKQIVPYGKYENVKGHIVVSHNFQIEGISTQALEQLKIKIHFYRQKNIEDIVPKFKTYVQELQLQYEKFQNQELERVNKLSTSDKFEYQQYEQLLVHFSTEVEHIPVIIQQRYRNQQDIYTAHGIITMSIGNIHSKLYQAYQISFKKIALAENQSSSCIYETIKQQNSQGSLKPFDSIQGIVNVASDSGDISDSIQGEEQMDDCRNILDYQMPQLYSNFQTPQDSSRLLNSNPQIQVEQQLNILKSLEIQEDDPVDDAEDTHQQQCADRKSSHRNKKRVLTRQQDYFHEQASKRQKLSELDLLDGGTENNKEFYEKGNQNESQMHIHHDNVSVNSLLQKSQFYTKFSRRNNTPKLMRVILGLDILNIAIIFVMAEISQAIYNNNMNENQNLLSVFLPFTTMNYLTNSFLGMSQLCNKDNSTLQDEVTSVITYNLDAKELSMQIIFNKQVLTDVVSSVNISIYDYFNKEMIEVSAWTEIFEIQYQLEILSQFDPKNDTHMKETKEAIYILLYSFLNHIDAYENITTQFYENMLVNFEQRIITQQLVITLITAGIESVVFLFYIVTYIYLLRLQKRILRSCEQIQIIAIEGEKIRFWNILQNYKAASELNLYKYQFTFRDKIQIDKQNVSQYQSLRLASLPKTEQLKQLQIQDDTKFRFQNCILAYPLVGILLCCFYLLYILLVDYNETKVLENQLSQFNLYIYYCQEITELTFVNYMLQNIEILTSIGIGQDLFSQYQAQAEEAYVEFIEFDKKFKYQDTSMDSLNQMVQNVCLIISNQLCNTIAEGRLTEGLLYSIQYYTDLIRDNIDNNYEMKNIRKLYRDDLLAVNFIAESLTIMINASQISLWDTIQQYKNERLNYFIIFLILICIIYLIEIIFVYRNLKIRFYRCRQLPYLLPPQSIFGEESFQKSLQYIEKMYHKIIQ